MNDSESLTIIKPDDWHLHLRDNDMLKAVLPDSLGWCGRAIIMPNLASPVINGELADAYRSRIMDAINQNKNAASRNFTPLMTLYLTDQTTPEDVSKAYASGSAFASKLYPAHATTNSAFGVTDIEHIAPTLERMAEIDMPLLIHGEVSDQSVDIFDREAAFIETRLKPIRARFPQLRITLEHITTAEGVEFVKQAGEKTAATVTAHHLFINRSDIFKGGIRPHLYCLPIAKREKHRLALIEAVTSGHARFFLGTDSAPHPQDAKESACGCAGVYTAHAGIQLYAEAFDLVGKIDQLEKFSSINGPHFHGIPVNQEKITLRKKVTSVPEKIETHGQTIIPFRAGETISWAID